MVLARNEEELLVKAKSNNCKSMLLLILLSVGYCLSLIANRPEDLPLLNISCLSNPVGLCGINDTCPTCDRDLCMAAPRSMNDTAYFYCNIPGLADDSARGCYCRNDSLVATKKSCAQVLLFSDPDFL